MSDLAEFQPVTRTEICSLAAVRRVAAMLDLDPETVVEGDPLPNGWHFVLLGADTRRSALRSDGFPGLGVPMPDFGLPRLMLGGRTVDYLRPIPVGATVHRSSVIKSLKEKSNAAGQMVIVTIGHELRVADANEPAVGETQTYVLLGGESRFKETQREKVDVLAPHLKTVTPDETLLFQYSALGFNSHKIHIDRAHAREVEGFPDLVVNGGLTTLLLTEFARNELGLDLQSFKMKHVAPLFCGRELTLAAEREGGQWRMKAYDEAGTVAAEMEVEVK
ncbi:MaoC/PaaZ C-terminal domain-containing protein [Burkholderia multivorans]|uniref:MaoC/PaaZ C-terminal domain-containing protein n=1 Tax=Burkholderia multivorans TaxID=87883 RepID=UPI00158D1639|nr:MaoC/PaaZ C-terminal domain-containing protein [Burkholderia multivorans]